MRIAVLKETGPGEQRVALVPESCKKLIASGYDIAIEQAAGDSAGYRDDEYREVGVAVQSDPASLTGSADIGLKVRGAGAGAWGGGIEWIRAGVTRLGLHE